MGDFKVYEDKFVSFEDVEKIVNTVVEESFVVNGDDGSLEYSPLYRDLYEKVMFASYFTDIDKDITLTGIYSIIGNTYLYDTNQWMDIDNIIDKTIDVKRKQLEQQKQSRVLDIVTDILNKQLEKETKELKLQEDLEKFIDKQNKISEEYSKEDIEKLQETIAVFNQNINSKDMLDAVVKQIKVDTTKENLQDHKSASKSENVIDINATVLAKKSKIEKSEE